MLAIAPLSNLSSLTQKSRSNIVVGCTAAVVSSACQSVGLILQRKSHIVSQNSNSNHVQPPSYNRSLWHIGLFLFLFANIFGSSIQITSLPLIVLSPLQSIGLVFNTIFHTVMLHEPFTPWSLYGTVLISVGAFLTAYCGGSLTEPEYSLSQFIEFLQNINFIYLVMIDIFIIMCLSVSIVLINKQLYHNTLSKHLRKLETKLGNIEFKLDSYDDATFINGTNDYLQMCFLLVSQRMLNCYKNALQPTFIHPSNTLRKVKGIFYGIISGILSGFSILLAKSSIEILITTFINKNWKSLNESTSYFIVSVFLSLGISQLYLLNKGLKNITTSVLYPLVFFIYNTVTISNSLVFFKQWNQLTYFTFFLLVVGLSLVMIGVFLLSIQNIEASDQPFSPISTGSSVRQFSPILKSKARYYDSIGSRVDHPYRDSISENDSFEDDIVDMTHPEEPVNEPVTDTSTADSGNILSSSIGTISHHMSPNFATNNDILAPFIRRTTENINSAGRKVSGFLKTSIQNTTNTSTVNSNTLNSENSNLSQTSESSFKRLVSPGNANHDIHEYVSFDSLREMANTPATYNNHQSGSRAGSIKTITANLSSDFDSLLQENNTTSKPNDTTTESNSAVSHGLNILHPILGKIKKQTSMLEIPQLYTPSSYENETNSSSTNNGTNSANTSGSNNNNNNSYNYNNSLSKIPSSYKSIAFSLKNLASFDINDSDKSPRTRKKTNSSKRLNIDDDYNPNNNFNYSFNNTLEEIQHQMSEYESPSTGHVPSPKTRKAKGVNESFEDTFNEESSNISNKSNTSNDSPDSPVFTTRIPPRAYSAKYRTTDSNLPQHQRTRSRELRRSTIGDINIRAANYKGRTHKRILSFEQNELLNDLKK